jgi:hypothetical protein
MDFRALRPKHTQITSGSYIGKLNVLSAVQILHGSSHCCQQVPLTFASRWYRILSSTLRSRCTLLTPAEHISSLLLVAEC